TIHLHFAKYFGGPEPLRSGVFIAEQPCFIVSSPAELWNVSRVLEQLPSRTFYLGGHAGLHHLREAGIEVDESDLILSLVRDPVERAVSLYFLALRSPDWFAPKFSEAARMGFEYFYSFSVDTTRYFDNAQCRLIANSTEYAEAIGVIERSFDLIGTTSKISMFETELHRLCATRLPQFHLLPERENAAWHKQTGSGEWVRQTCLDDIVDTTL